MRFEIKESEDYQFYFILIADNGETVATSETYSAKHNAFKTANSIAATDIFEVVDKTGEDEVDVTVDQS